MRRQHPEVHPQQLDDDRKHLRVIDQRNKRIVERNRILEPVVEPILRLLSTRT